MLPTLCFFRTFNFVFLFSVQIYYATYDFKWVYPVRLLDCFCGRVVAHFMHLAEPTTLLINIIVVVYSLQLVVEIYVWL